MPLKAEELDLLTLHLVPGIGPRICAALLGRFGTATRVLQASREELLRVPHLPEKTVVQMQNFLSRVQVDEECALMEKHQVEVRFLGQPNYPDTLASLDFPPQVLYVKGTLDPRNERCIAMVGSRSCTSYGRRMAEKIAHDLARAGWTVVSGLARGIDGCAHRGVLKAGGKTLAVLAGGLSKIYPPEHAELADEIVAASGGLITEAAMPMEPMAGMFPARNRIISGLCRGVVVIEANDKSGALITARHAAEQGREVFALPGAADNLVNAGSLRLLREGAKLVRHADDILEDLQGLAPLFEPQTPIVVNKPTSLDEVQQRVWDFLEERRTTDDVTRHLAIGSGETMRILFQLEMKKVIRRLPGNWYERV